MASCSPHVNSILENVSPASSGPKISLTILCTLVSWSTLKMVMIHSCETLIHARPTKHQVLEDGNICIHILFV
jgi:hypothetical protein